MTRTHAWQTRDYDGALTASQGEALRERLYGALSCLSLLVTLRTGHETAWESVATLLITAAGLWGAAMVADLLSHTAVHADLPSRTDVGHAFAATFQIVVASLAPVAILALAGFGVMSVDTALVTATVILEVELGLFAFVAVWRTPLTWPRKMFVIAIVALIGLGVVVLKALVH